MTPDLWGALLGGGMAIIGMIVGALVSGIRR